MKKIAVVLSGCGNRDGSELQETLSLLLAVDKKGWQYQCFAPEGLFEVVSHVDGYNLDEDVEEGSVVDVEERDVFVESARIARGDIKPLSEYRPADFDALFLPGGMGAARNLSTFAYEGEKMMVIDILHDAILETYRAQKPIAAMCIAPMILARVLGRYEITLTLGNTCPASEVAQALGARHQICSATEVCVDADHKIVTTPAYMVASRISEIFAGGEALVDAVSEML